MSDTLLHADAMYLSMSSRLLFADFDFDFDFSLFDMDGTLVDSTAGVKGAWNLFRETYPTIDVDYILSCEHLYFQYTAVVLYFSETASHGVRTIDNLRTHCGIQDPEILKVSAS